MALKIRDLSSKKPVPFDCVEVVNGLLRHVPPEHLVGLGEIALVDVLSKEAREGIRGAYLAATREGAARIEISVPGIYARAPRFLFRSCFLRYLYLADVLYHEIGHHYVKRLRHGIDRKRGEVEAERYKKAMLRKAFPVWRRVLAPIGPLVRWLLRRAEGAR